jgi:hypothetical protein
VLFKIRKRRGPTGRSSIKTYTLTEKAEPDKVMAVEIEFTREGEVRGDFQVTGTAQNRIIPRGQKLDIDVILLDRLVAFIKALVFPPFFADKIPGSHSPDIFFVSDDTKHMITTTGEFVSICFLNKLQLGAIHAPIHRRPPENLGIMFCRLFGNM